MTTKADLQKEVSQLLAQNDELRLENATLSRQKRELLDDLEIKKRDYREITRINMELRLRNTRLEGYIARVRETENRNPGTGAGLSVQVDRAYDNTSSLPGEGEYE